MADRRQLHLPRLPRAPLRGRGGLGGGPPAGRGRSRRCCATGRSRSSTACATSAPCRRRSASSSASPSCCASTRPGGAPPCTSRCRWTSVAVKTFDAAGRVNGERQLRRPLHRRRQPEQPAVDPPAPGQDQAGPRPRRLPPNSYDGKNLRHIIETYPRDELFQIPVDELYRIARRRPAAAGAPARRLLPAPRSVRALRLLPRLRAARPLRHRPAAQARRRARRGLPGHGDLLAGVPHRIACSPASRSSSRTQPGHIPDVDPDEVERRLAEVARSWEDRLREALVAAPRRGRGAGAHPALPATPSRRATRTASAATPRCTTSSSSSSALATDGLTQNLYRPAGAPPRGAALQGLRHAARAAALGRPADAREHGRQGGGREPLRRHL